MLHRKSIDQHKLCWFANLFLNIWILQALCEKKVPKIYICYLPFRSVRIEKYFVSVSKTYLGLRPRAVFETSTKYFSIRTSQPVNNIYIFLVLFFHIMPVKSKCLKISSQTSIIYVDQYFFNATQHYYYTGITQ